MQKTIEIKTKTLSTPSSVLIQPEIPPNVPIVTSSLHGDSLLNFKKELGTATPATEITTTTNPSASITKGTSNIPPNNSNQVKTPNQQGISAEPKVLAVVKTTPIKATTTPVSSGDSTIPRRIIRTASQMPANPLAVLNQPSTKVTTTLLIQRTTTPASNGTVTTSPSTNLGTTQPNDSLSTPGTPISQVNVQPIGGTTPATKKVETKSKVTMGPLTRTLLRDKGIAKKLTSNESSTKVNVDKETEGVTPVTQKRGKVISLLNVTSPPDKEKDSLKMNKPSTIVSQSLRPDGTTRKPLKVRAGYVPPEEKPKPVTLDEEEEEDDIDILGEDTEENSTDLNSTSTSDNSTVVPSTNKRLRPNQNFLTRVLNSTNLYNTRILPTLLEKEQQKQQLIVEESTSKTSKSKRKEEQEEEEEDEEEDIEGKEEEEKEEEEVVNGGKLEGLFKKTSKSILKEIDKYRLAEGTLLLKAIAKRYGIKIKILGPQEEEGIEEDQVEEEEERPQKKQRVVGRVSVAKRIGSHPQVKLKRVRGAIGYKNLFNGE